MTLEELFDYLNTHTTLTILDGTVVETVHKVLAGTHQDVLMGEILLPIIKVKDCEDAKCTLDRAEAVSALGATRLKYMADDAPVEGFRAVEDIIRTIDGAFNDEALRARQAH